MRTEIEKIKNTELTLIADPRMKWEVLKYRIRQFSRSYSINAAGKRNHKRQELDRKVIEMESKICSSSSDYVLKEYHEAKAELEQIYDYITKGIILRSRSTWYEKGEKSTKYFLTLEKRQKSKTFVKRLIFRETELSDCRDISFTIREFYSNLFSRKSVMTVQDCEAFLDTLDIPSLMPDERDICEDMINVNECFNCLQSMHSNKTLGNDGITREFYIAFFDLIKDLLMSSINYSWKVGELSTSQKQAVITLIEKKGKDKRYIQN